MDFKDIKAIVDLMKKNSLAEFELEKPDFKIRLKRTGNGGSTPPAMEDAPPPQVVYQSAAPPPAPAQPAAPPSGELDIKSPMVGTFYRAPSPESPNYVDVGTEVGPETVVCIIEAMKVMNEIKAEARGIVTQALVENAKPVEFGQALFKIRPL